MSAGNAKAKRLMVQGTASSAGKSLLVTALCRIFRRKGFAVAPFKSQNMSLNSFITEEGLEMGRAQVAQAEAAGVEPSALMNPILLKPGSDHRSQVIVKGRVYATMDAREYYKMRHTLRPAVLDAFNQLAARHEYIFIEGAGSPAEINLRENDLANMGVAGLTDSPVILVGDIDRGGVFASLYGTVKLLEPDEQKRIRGLVINKFRGDAAILEPGLRQLEDLLGIPVLGVLPYLDITLDEEDSLAERLNKQKHALGLKSNALQSHSGEMLDIAVLRLPRMSNFTDFAVFDTQPDAVLRYVADAPSLNKPDLVIVPGSKSSIDDMRFLRESGLAGALIELHKQEVPIIGICGGFQMLGRRILDPDQVESDNAAIDGLGLLDMETRFASIKKTTRTRLSLLQHKGVLQGTEGMEPEGYEIHMGRSTPGPGCHFLAKRLPGGGPGLNYDIPAKCEAEYGNLAECGQEDDNSAGCEGAVSGDGKVIGTYLHGFFDNLSFTRTLLNNLRLARRLPPLPPVSGNYADFRESEYERLADAVEKHLDMALLERIIQGQDLP